MKKLLPYVFPIIAVLIVVFLLFRWYRMNVQRQAGDISRFGEGVEIENLSENELKEQLRGSNNSIKSVEMTSTDPAALGTIRYEIKDGKVRFSVMASLPELTAGSYQVWLRDVAGTSTRQAFVLEEGKGGFIGSAAVATEVLPFQVVVSRELQQDATVEQVLLEATLEEMTASEAK